MDRTRISIMFKQDAARTPFWPSYIYRPDRPMDIYDCILARTDNHELAAEVSGWAELACFGEEYDCDELNATIMED